MLHSIDGEAVRNRVLSLLKEKGISKTKLGEVLGTTKQDARIKIARANRFLTGAKKNISIKDINKLAEFFERPSEYFLFGESSSTLLYSPHVPKNREEKSLKDIADSLQKLGFDDEFIKNQIEQLKAIKAFREKRS